MHPNVRRDLARLTSSPTAKSRRLVEISDGSPHTWAPPELPADGDGCWVMLRYFSELFMSVNLVLRLEPKPLTTAMIASEMPAAIRPYSMAVAPDSSCMKRAKSLVLCDSTGKARMVSASWNWIISETTSPVDYRPQIAGLTTARAASQDAPSSLAIHCRAHRTELIISTTASWKQVPDGDVKVVHRINEEPSVEQRWRAAETGKSLAFPGDVVRFLLSMQGGGGAVVKVYAGKIMPSESTFQLAGLDSVRRKIATACNWPQPWTTL